jgi:hypothetical protein
MMLSRSSAAFLPTVQETNTSTKTRMTKVSRRPWPRDAHPQESEYDGLADAVDQPN